MKNSLSDALDIMPLSEARWPDLAALFSQGGDPKTCWCAFWRLRGKDWSFSSREKNRELLRSLAGRDPAPGLVAYADGTAVGWVSVGPREDFERLEHSRVRPRLDDLPVWSIVCFVVARAARRRGVTRALLGAAIEYAGAHGAPALEAYPVDPGDTRIPSANGYTGLLSIFEDAGFEVVRAIDSPQATVRRVIVRRALP